MFVFYFNLLDIISALIDRLAKLFKDGDLVEFGLEYIEIFF
jgi:hypothetical protein